MIFPTSIHVLAKNALGESGMIADALTTTKDMDLNKRDNCLQMLGVLQQIGLIRSIDRNFARFILDGLNSMSHNTAELGDVALFSALLSKHVGNGHVCLPLAKCIAEPAQLLPIAEIKLNQNNQQHYQQYVSNVKCVHSFLSSQDIQALCDKLDDLQLVNPTPEQLSRGENCPLRLANGRLYLERLFVCEQKIQGYLEQACKVLGQFDDANHPATDLLRQTLNVLFATENETQARNGMSQKLACAIAARSQFAIITGGPGTGKTTTVVKLLAAMQSMANSGQLQTSNNNSTNALNIALAAPTGKAAARLSESISGAISALALQDLPNAIDKRSIPSEVITIHSMLGQRRNSRKFRYNADNKLAVDVLVIDEASMVDIELMAAVIDALPTHARLILLGDKDQLASVDAGAVLGDLAQGAGGANYSANTIAWLEHVLDCEPASLEHLKFEAQGSKSKNLLQHLAMLDYSFRFSNQSAIKRLADAVTTSDDTNAVFEQLANNQLDDVIWIKDELATTFTASGELRHSEQLLSHIKNGSPERFGESDNPAVGYLEYWTLMQTSTSDCWQTDQHDAFASKVLDAFDRFRVLCVVREGAWGVSQLNKSIEASLRSHSNTKSLGDWYAGRPVLITQNDYNLGLMNGDIGICFAFDSNVDTEDSSFTFKVAFRANDASGAIRWFSVNRLQNLQTAFALTVHKAQGSEFSHTCLVLPEQQNPVLTKELIYTAITRAKHYFSLLTPQPDILKQAIKLKVNRDSGLFLGVNNGNLR